MHQFKTNHPKRNGNVKSIKEIVENLNNAKLDPNTGTPILFPNS